MSKIKDNILEEQQKNNEELDRTYQEKQALKETCPCGMNGNCCENPQIINPDHECSDENVCEECYVLECINCGKSCGHEL